jgi:hypothetical protein
MNDSRNKINSDHFVFSQSNIYFHLLKRHLKVQFYSIKPILDDRQRKDVKTTLFISHILTLIEPY